MRKTFKYRIYPNKKQIKRFDSTIDNCRILYNDLLSKKINLYKDSQKSLTQFDMNKIISEFKQEKSCLNNIHSQVLQNVSMRVQNSFRLFFQRLKEKNLKAGFPRFRSKDRYHSFTFPQSGFSLTKKNNIKLSKIGVLKTIYHRPLEGEVKTLTITKTHTKKWYACFSVEIDKVMVPNSIENPVGIDMGLEKFLMCSDETIVKNPRFLKKESKNLSNIQRRYSLNKNRKNRHSLSLVHERIKNKRDDFLHKVSHNLINKYNPIIMENLRPSEMVDKDRSWRSIRKSILDASWNKLMNFVSYKAEEAGSIVKFINPRNTSKMCSGCYELVEKSLSDRVHNCPHCGLSLDRDLNASYNILRLGMQSFSETSLEVS